LNPFWKAENTSAEPTLPATAVVPPIAPLAIGTPIASPTFCAAWSWVVWRASSTDLPMVLLYVLVKLSRYVCRSDP
jgi:hypothetical protein